MSWRRHHEDGSYTDVAPWGDQPITHEVVGRARPVDGPGGFCVGWLDGEGQGLTFSLTAGAGCGNARLTLTVHKGDETRIEAIDMRKFIEPWLTAIGESIDAGEPNPLVLITTPADADA